MELSPLPTPTKAVLIIDWGNTRIKIAVFDTESSEQLAFFSLKSLTIDYLTRLFAKYPIKKGILCSVVHHSAEISAFLHEKIAFTELSSDTKLPILLKYRTPQTLGRDRIASICGAWAQFPNEYSLVIDAGTCIKYDFVTSDGHYIGGSISPGIGMRFRAMHEFTAKLPLIERGLITEFVGDTTETALRTGGQLGAAMEARSFANLYKETYGNSINIIVTGGDGTYLVKHISQAIYQKDLLLKGLLFLVKESS
jgi:type III pantothenate kinase